MTTPNRIAAKTWEFPTTPTRKPLEVKVTASRTTDERLTQENEMRLYIEISGLMHPHLDVANYMGDVSKNPALLAPAKRLVEILTQAVHDEIEKNPKLKQASNKTLKGDETYTTTTANAGSYSMFTDFNLPTWQCQEGKQTYTPLERPDMAALHGAISAAMEKAKPEIEKLMADNAHLQPSEKPTPNEVMGIRQRDENTWSKSMDILKKEQGFRTRGGSPKADYSDN